VSKDLTKVLYVLQIKMDRDDPDWVNYAHPQYGSPIVSARRESVESELRRIRYPPGMSRVATYTRTDPE
jgi:hypothetical protein